MSDFKKSLFYKPNMLATQADILDKLIWILIAITDDSLKVI